MEAQRYGAKIVGAEIIGLVPKEALEQSLAYYLKKEEIAEGEYTLEQLAEEMTKYLQLEGFSVEQILEYKLKKANA